MTLEKDKQGIGLFANYLDVEVALQELKGIGFPQQQISFVAPMENLHDELTGIYHSHYPGDPLAEEAKARVASGGLFGSLVDLLDNVKSLKIPLLGQERSLIAGGELANKIREDADRTEFSLINALLSSGVPPERAKFYSDRVSQGECLILINGSANSLAQAAQVLAQREIQAWEVYLVQLVDNQPEILQEEIATTTANLEL